MSGGIIPGWNSQGVLPPVDTSNPVSLDRSPYLVSLDDFVLRFGTSSERLNILDGILSFRSALHEAGIVRGFQWLDGSFLENIESLESRPPRDIDVVTFYYLPLNHTQVTLLSSNPQLFDRDLIKTSYHVDAYFIDLMGNIPEELISNSAYWYSVWSHRRNSIWKGYLQIDLSQTDDHIARDNVDKMMSRGGTP
jgi:hypothetical protein